MEILKFICFVIFLHRVFFNTNNYYEKNYLCLSNFYLNDDGVM